MEINRITDNDKLEPFLDLAKCNICFLIPLQPCTCKKCEAVFCKLCITNWSTKSPKCPFCRVDPMRINEDAYVIKNVISKFSYECHVCKNKILLSNFNDHNKICKEDLVQCELVCGELIPSSFLKTHMNLFCKNGITKCPCCRTQVMRSELKYDELHYDDDKSKTMLLNKEKIKELERELRAKDEIISKMVANEKSNNINNNNQNKEMIKLENEIDLSDARSNVYLPKCEITSLNLKNFLTKTQGTLLSVHTIEYFMNNNISYILLFISNGEIVLYEMTGSINQNRSIDRHIKTAVVHSDNFTDVKSINSINSLLNSNIMISNSNTCPIYITASYDGMITKINPADLIKYNSNSDAYNKLIQKHSKILESPATCLQIGMTNDYLIIGDATGHLRLLQVNNFEQILSRKVHSTRVVLIQHTGVNNIIISFSKAKTLSITKLEDFNTLKTVNLNYYISSAIYHPYNNAFYAISEYGDIYKYSDKSHNIIKNVYKGIIKGKKNGVYKIKAFGDKLMMYNNVEGIMVHKIEGDGLSVAYSSKSSKSVSCLGIVENGLGIFDNNNDHNHNEGDDFNLMVNNKPYSIVAYKSGEMTVIEALRMID